MTSPIGQSSSEPKTYDSKIEIKLTTSPSSEAQEDTPLEQGPASVDQPNGKLRNGDTQSDKEGSNRTKSDEALESAIWSDRGANQAKQIKKAIKDEFRELERKAREAAKDEEINELYAEAVSMSATDEDTEDLTGPDSGKKASERSSAIAQATKFSSSTADELDEDSDSKQVNLSGGFDNNKTLNLEETIS